MADCLFSIEANAKALGEYHCRGLCLKGSDLCFYHEMKTLVESLERKYDYPIQVKIQDVNSLPPYRDRQYG